MRGRKPKPTALKVLQGTRADRVNAAEPAALKGRPDAPDHLGDVARAEWDRIVPLLEELGVLSRTDGSALALYCCAFERWREAEGEIKDNGLTVETDKGSLKTNPAVGIANAAKAEMARLLVEFGCTPSARSRVKAGAEGPKDKLSEFMARAQKGRADGTA